MITSVSFWHHRLAAPVGVGRASRTVGGAGVLLSLMAAHRLEPRSEHRHLRGRVAMQWPPVAVRLRLVQHFQLLHEST